MDYKEKCEFFTQEKIPEVWKRAVEAEKLAELMVYSLISECLDNFEDVYFVLGSNSNIAKVLRSWERKEDISFGKHAIRLTDDGEKLEVSCKYDIYELNEDMEMLSTDMFGRFDSKKVGETVLFDDNIKLSDEVFNEFQKKITRRGVTTLQGQKDEK